MIPTAGQRDINLLPKLKKSGSDPEEIKLTRVAALFAVVALLSLAVYGPVIRRYWVTAEDERPGR